MRIPTQWWFLGGGLLLTLWLVWKAPPAPDNKKVIEVVQLSAKPDGGEIETQPHYQTPVKRPSPEMISDLFRTPSIPNVPEITNSNTQKTLLPLPFRYIGRLEKEESVTVFVMDGEALHVLQAGDSPHVDYQLESVDLVAGELRWRYLPTQKIRNMSIKP